MRGLTNTAQGHITPYTGVCNARPAVPRTLHFTAHWDQSHRRAIRPPVRHAATSLAPDKRPLAPSLAWPSSHNPLTPTPARHTQWQSALCPGSTSELGHPVLLSTNPGRANLREHHTRPLLAVPYRAFAPRNPMGKGWRGLWCAPAAGAGA